MRPCRLHTGCTNERYGTVYLPGVGMVYAHRQAWETANGPIPDGMQVLHHCDVPLCIEPTHLFLGTQADNMADAKRKGRLAPGDATRHLGAENGRAKLTPEQVAEIRSTVRPNPSGVRGGNMNIKKAAERYRVSRPVIKAILAGEAWR